MYKKILRMKVSSKHELCAFIILVSITQKKCSIDILKCIRGREAYEIVNFIIYV